MMIDAKYVVDFKKWVLVKEIFDEKIDDYAVWTYDLYIESQVNIKSIMV